MPSHEQGKVGSYIINYDKCETSCSSTKGVDEVCLCVFVRISILIFCVLRCWSQSPVTVAIQCQDRFSHPQSVLTNCCEYM
jgi:hypothetical protein